MSGSTDSATIAKGKTYAQQVHALLGHEAVLDLNFNENAYGTCLDGKDACDASGYNNNGIIYGASFISSPIDGTALFFDGVDDYIDCGNGADLNINDKITLTAWIYPIEYIAGTGIVQKGTGSWWNVAYGLVIRKWNDESNEAASIYFNIGDGVNSDSLHTVDLPINNWYFLVGTYNNGTMTFYLNGVNISSKGTSVKPFIIASPVVIGTWYNHFKGIIDEVRIYSEAFSIMEIEKYYVQGLKKLLADNAISQEEYSQKISELN